MEEPAHQQPTLAQRGARRGSNPREVPDFILPERARQKRQTLLRNQIRPRRRFRLAKPRHASHDPRGAVASRTGSRRAPVQVRGALAQARGRSMNAFLDYAEKQTPAAVKARRRAVEKRRATAAEKALAERDTMLDLWKLWRKERLEALFS